MGHCIPFSEFLLSFTIPGSILISHCLYAEKLNFVSPYLSWCTLS